jgi:hypothetical protein
VFNVGGGEAKIKIKKLNEKRKQTKAAHPHKHTKGFFKSSLVLFFLSPKSL